MDTIINWILNNSSILGISALMISLISFMVTIIEYRMRKVDRVKEQNNILSLALNVTLPYLIGRGSKDWKATLFLFHPQNKKFEELSHSSLRFKKDWKTNEDIKRCINIIYKMDNRFEDNNGIISTDTWNEKKNQSFYSFPLFDPSNKELIGILTIYPHKGILEHKSLPRIAKSKAQKASQEVVNVIKESGMLETINDNSFV